MGLGVLLGVADGGTAFAVVGDVALAIAIIARQELVFAAKVVNILSVSVMMCSYTWLADGDYV